MREPVPAFAAALACFAAACSASDSFAPPPVAGAFGWTHPIATTNTTLAVDQPLGNADVIAGHSLREIVTEDWVRVRADGKSCQTCHAWAITSSRDNFCDVKIAAFLALPTTTGHADPPSAKPGILKDLLTDWRARGCPD